MYMYTNSYNLYSILILSYTMFNNIIIIIIILRYIIINERDPYRQDIL